MMVPSINRIEVQKLLELAEELIIPFKADLEYQNSEMEITKNEISAAQALVSIIKRGEKRAHLLDGTGEAGSYYCSKTASSDLNAHEIFISNLKYRLSRFTRRVDLCNQAIELLESDIADMKELTGVQFRHILVYLACIGDGPGWSFFMYRPEKWLERWSRKF